MKKTKFWREYEIVAVVIECPYCDEEIKYSTYEAEEMLTDLWYPQESEVECPECGNVFLVSEGEGNI